MRALYWSVLAAALLLYAVILLWSLPTISATAGGLATFDTRPAGYGFAEARTFLAALTPAGRDLYLSVQHRLDLVFPPLMALALAWSTLRWRRPLGGCHAGCWSPRLPLARPSTSWRTAPSPAC